MRTASRLALALSVFALTLSSPALTASTTDAPAAPIRPRQVDPPIGDLIRQERARTPGACALGYFWRLASPQDHACVTLATRSLTAQDNAAAADRTVAGTDRCLQGFVWREAFAGDHVCVLPQTRAQAAADNAATPSRLFSAQSTPAGAQLPALDLCPLLDPAAIAASLGIAGKPVAQTDVKNHCEIDFNDVARSLLDVDLVAADTSNFDQYAGASVPGLGSRAVLTPLMPPGSDGIRQQTLAVMQGNAVLLLSLDRQPQRGPEAFSPIAQRILAAVDQAAPCVSGSSALCPLAVDFGADGTARLAGQIATRASTVTYVLVARAGQSLRVRLTPTLKSAALQGVLRCSDGTDAAPWDEQVSVQFKSDARCLLAIGANPRAEQGTGGFQLSIDLK